MRYILDRRYRLRGWDLLPWAIVDIKSGRTQFILEQEMAALKLCNGKIDTDISLIPQELRDMIPKMAAYGVIHPCEPGETIDPIQEYHQYPARYIRTAHWSVTGRCNYRCRHCYMSAPYAKYGELSHDTIMHMIDELAECGVMNVSLTGGEALVRDDFKDIVDALIERDIRITTIFSNGAMVKKDLLQQLDDRDIHPIFNMSYDGIGYHDWLRGVPGAEDAVNKAFLLCRDMGFPTSAEMCIHSRNKDTLRKSILHLREVGCSSLKTNPVAAVGEWTKNGLENDISISEMFQLYMDYIPHYYEDGMPLSLMLGGFFSASPDKPDRWDIPMYNFPTDPTKRCVCNHARMVMYISPEGRALPCMSLSGMDIQEEFPLIPEIGLSKCITDSFYMNFINTRADKVLEHNPECGECEFKKWCLGGCRAGGLSDSDQKDLLYKDPAACELFKGGWITKLIKLMIELNPKSASPVLKDKELLDLCGLHLKGE